MANELRFALRKLAKSPGFAVVAILTLALGIGANTAIFSIIDNVLLQPPPFPQSDRLVALRCQQPAMTWAVVADLHEYLDWKEQTDLFSDVMLYNGFQNLTLADENTTRTLSAHTASANYLRTLGVRPVLGRDLTEADTRPNSAPVVLIGYALWQTQFAADPAIIGRAVRLSGKLTTVVGVLPKRFVSVTPDEPTVEALAPLTVTRESSPRGNHTFWVFARLRDGVSLAQARARMGEVAVRLQQERAIVHGIVVFSLQEWNTRHVRPRLFALMGAVALVLLIACVNLANLQFVRLTGRTAEISVKMAVGAGRWRIARELLFESAVIGFAGGVAGSALAFLTIKLAGNFIQSQFSTYSTLAVGPAALAFSVGITLLAVALSSLVPAWRATASWQQFMRSVGRSAVSTPQQRRLNHLFVVAQVGLTLLVLACAGLLVRSMHRLATQERGFSTDNLVTFHVDLPDAVYRQPGQRVRFFAQLLDRLRAIPGVEAAAAGDSLPLRSGTNGGFSVPGLTWPRGQEPLSDQLIVGPGYFRTFGIALQQGRDFDPALDRLPEGDGHFSASVIINESMARKYFSGRNPVGQPIGFSGDDGNQRADYVWDKVIGVVADARMVSLDREPGPAMYVSYTQAAPGSLYLAVRSKLDPAALLKPLREQLQSLDKHLPLSRLHTMQGYLDDALAQRKVITWTIASAAAVALGLAMLGLYSVIACTVTQQTREIGVRAALGAEPRMIGAWVLRRGVTLVGLGVVLGLGGSFIVSNLLGSLIYGVSAWDLVTYGTVVGTLAAVALLACWLPARRAARIDPVVALRTE
ncbi:MAG: ABC transporter permease [Opitutae bacterium]|nr:ABC transporter permease [Opitutae bacterium]